MDLLKIGKFISERRKLKNLTQNNIAEKLHITDRAVSKWECGKGLPDSSIMVELCEILNITVNELLCGEAIPEEASLAKAEAQILTLLQERQMNKRKLWWQITIGIAGMLVLLGSVLLTVFLVQEYALEKWIGALITVAGCLIFAALFFVTISIALQTGSFECKNCHHRFMPAAKAYITSIQCFGIRKLKCPACGKTTWCKPKLNK